MEIKDMCAVFVVAIVAGVLVSAMIPIFATTTDNIEGYAVYENPDRLAPYTTISAGDHIHWTQTEITVNDEIITGNRTTENWLKCEYILCANNQLFIYKTDGNTQLVSNCIYLDVTFGDDLSATVVLENNNTIGSPVTMVSAPMEWGFIIANEGDWCQIKYDSPDRTVYFNNLDQIYTSGPAGGLISSKGTTAYYKGVSYDEGIVFNGVSEVANGVYSMTFGLGSLTYNVAGIGNDDIRVIVAPLSVESTRTPSATADMINLIPLVICAGLVVMFVGALIIRRV